MINRSRRQMIFSGLLVYGTTIFQRSFLGSEKILSESISSFVNRGFCPSVSNDLQFFFGGVNVLKQDLRTVIAEPFLGLKSARVTTSAELRRIDASAFMSLGGQPYGLSVEERLKVGSLNQEQADRAASGSAFDLVYIGSINNSYGRCCRGDGDFTRSVVEATGVQYQLFKLEGLKTRNTQAPVSTMSLISDAYPHYYHILKSPLASFDRYLVDRESRSSESLYIQIPKEESWGAKSDLEKLKVGAEKLAKKYTQIQLRRENEYLDSIKKILPTENVRLPDSMYDQYCRLLKNSEFRQA